MVNYWFNIPYLSLLAWSLNNSQKCSVIHYRHGYDVHRVCAFVARGMNANHQGAGAVVVRVALNTRAIGGQRNQNAFDSTDKHRSPAIFQWRLLFFVSRTSREFNAYDPHCAISFFPYRRD